MAASPYCPRCGAANPPEEETCFACGGALATTPGTLPERGVQRVLRQRYQMLRQIGAGGFGAVYQAEDTQLGQRLVAVKEMSARGLTAEESMRPPRPSTGKRCCWPGCPTPTCRASTSSLRKTDAGIW